MTRRMTPPVRLIAYEFAPGAEYEGRLVGAIVRIESGGTLRIVDVLFVMASELVDPAAFAERTADLLAAAGRSDVR